MYVPEKLKVNRFKEVRIPHKREIYGLHGFKEATSSQYTGENEMYKEANKTEKLAELMKMYDDYMKEHPEE